jgi:hypothetical protein
MSSRQERWREYERAWLRKHAMQRRLARIFKQGEEPDDHEDDELDADNGNDNGDNGERHLVDQLADLLVEAGSSDGEVLRQDALRWLLHSRDGQALVGRMAAHRKQIDAAINRKGFQMPTRQEVLKGYVRSAGGVIPLCKRIVAKGVTDISEHELTQLAVDAAKREYGISDDARAFAKMFTDTGPTGDTLRQAIQLAKVAQVGGDDGDADDVAAALEELHRLADAHRRRNPELTPSQAFARVFADPRNAALAHRAHKRPTANAKNAFPFPR